MVSGAHVVQYSCAGDYLNNQWTFVHEDDTGPVLLMNRRSLMCLNVSGYGLDDGAKLVQYECDMAYDNERLYVM